MKRPLCVSIVFFIFGIVLGRWLPLGSTLFLLLGILLAGCFYFSRKTGWRWIYSFFVFFFVGYGFCAIHWNTTVKALEAVAQSQKTIQMKGTVLEVSVTRTGKPKLKMQVEKIYLEKEWQPQKVTLLCYLREGTFDVGEQLVLKGTLNLLEPQRNPGGYNEKLTLKTQGIQYTCFADVVSVEGKTNSIPVILSKIKQKTIGIYDQILPEREAGVMKQMILGEKNQMEDDLRELYAVSGIYHIVAISGMHIMILVVAILAGLQRILPMRTSSILCLLIIVLYCIFTGASPSSVRAVIMAGVILMGNVLYRTNDLLTSIAFSAFCILLWNPLMLWNIGFLLSYGAVLGIGLCTTGVDRMLVLGMAKSGILQRMFQNEWIRSGTVAFISVNIVTVPIIAFYFYYFSPYALFVNLIVAPTVSFLVILGIVCCILGVFHIGIASFLSGTIYFILKFYEGVCTFFYRLPFSKILIGSPELWVIIVYGVGVFFFIKIFTTIQQQRQRYIHGCIYFILFLILWMTVRFFIPQPLKVVMLDVGQGDCFVISNEGQTIVIDGGKDGYELQHYLNWMGKTTVDVVFVSHTDGDHAQGIIDILPEKNIRQILLPMRDNSESATGAQLIALAKAQNMPVQTIQNGDIISLGSKGYLKCLSPTTTTASMDVNNGALVLKMTYGTISFLFTGDIEAKAEEALLKEGLLSDCQVLKVAHHGSKTSSTEAFLEKVLPQIALISVGKDNSYGHPNAEVIQRLSQLDASLFRTDTDGAVILTTNGETLHVLKTIP